MWFAARASAPPYIPHPPDEAALTLRAPGTCTSSRARASLHRLVRHRRGPVVAAEERPHVGAVKAVGGRVRLVVLGGGWGGHLRPAVAGGALLPLAALAGALGPGAVGGLLQPVLARGLGRVGLLRRRGAGAGLRCARRRVRVSWLGGLPGAGSLRQVCSPDQGIGRLTLAAGLTFVYRLACGVCGTL